MEHHLPLASWIYFIYNIFRIATLSQQCFSVLLGNGSHSPDSRIPFSGGAQAYANFYQKKPVSRVCIKEDEPQLWLCVSLRDCPAMCSKAVFAAKGLHLSSVLVGCSVQAAHQSSLGLYLRWSDAVVAVCHCRHACSAASQPMLGPDICSREGEQATPLPQPGTSSLLFFPLCPQHCRSFLCMSSTGTDGRCVCAGLARVGLLLLGARIFSSHNQVGPQGFCKVHCEKKLDFWQGCTWKRKWDLPFLLIQHKHEMKY